MFDSDQDVVVPVPRVLIIDENDEKRARLESAFTKAGFAVDAVGDGQVGVQHFTERPADVIVCAVAIANRRGVDAFTELRRRFPDVPLVVLSEGARATFVQLIAAARSLGALLALEAAVDVEEVVEAVCEVLAGRDL